MSAVLKAVAPSGTANSEVAELEGLVIEFTHAKLNEELAKKKRLDVEERILALMPVKEEGSTTVVMSSGLKLVLTGKLNYKCDNLKAMAEFCAQWPANMVPVKTELKLDETGCKWLRGNDPEAWASLAQFVTVTPAKTAVKVSS